MNKKELNAKEMKKVNAGDGNGTWKCPNCGSHNYRHNPLSGACDYDFICNDCGTRF